MINTEYPLVDTHSHILPGMDDGAINPEMGVNMVNSLLDQGVKRIFATSHFYYHKENIQKFLERREHAYMQLMSEWRKCGKPERPFLLGAEVSIERDLTYTSDLDKLCIEGTNILLLELPFNKLRGWEISTLENIVYKYKIRPMLAHVDRYLEIYSQEDLKKLYEIPDVIFQINASCVEQRKDRSFVLKLIKSGAPVVLGSDAHNMEERKPEYIKLINYLRKKLDKSTYDRLIYDIYKLLNFTM